MKQNSLISWTLIILVMIFIGHVCISDLHALEFSFGEHKLSLKLAHLENPRTWGVALKNEPTPNDNELDLSVKLDVLLAVKSSLNEKANADIAYNLTWKIPGEKVKAPQGQPTQRRFYRGRIGLELGIESAREKLVDGKPGDWRVANWNIGPVWEQHIPFTRLRFPWCSQRWWPLIIGGGFKYVSEVKEKSDSWRGFFYIDWEAAIFSTTSVSGFIGGRFEGYIIDDGAKHCYKEGRAQISLPVLHVDFIGDPLIFAKYINGEQPPEFDNRDEWNFGIGTELTW